MVMQSDEDPREGLPPLISSPYLLEPHRTPLGYANSFHTLAPSHVLCPRSGNFSLFIWLTPTHPLGTSFSVTSSKKPSPTIHSGYPPSPPGCMVSLTLICFLLSPFPSLQLCISLLWSPPPDHNFPAGTSCCPLQV